VEFRHLQYLMAVADSGSFTRAAEHLIISQPTLSKAIHDLEDELGVTLLDRNRHPVTLTDAGLILYQAAQQIQAVMSRAATELAQVREAERGTVRVGLPPMMSSSVAAEILSRFRQQYPHVDLVIQEIGGHLALKQLQQGDLDCTFAVLSTDEIDIESLLVWSEPMVAVLPANHPLAKRSAVSLEELSLWPMVLYPEEYSLYQRVMQAFRQKSTNPKIVQTSAEWDFLGRMVASGLGFTLLPISLAERLPYATIRRIPLADVLGWDIALVRSTRYYQSFAADALWHIAEAYRWSR